jgi:hypothetical protein
VAVSLATFLVNYPEFTNAPSGMVQNALNDAYGLTPVGVWATYTDQGAQLRAAQAMAHSPFGVGLSLSRDDGTTIYDQRLSRLVQMVAAGGSHT